MIDATEPLSLVIWSVFFLAAGMYPLGIMLGAPCSPCCDQSAECEPLFHRCLRELSVDGSDPAKTLSVPSREIFTHAEAALVKASEKAVVSVAITIPSLAAIHLNPGEQLQYTAAIALSVGTEKWNAVIPSDAKTKSISITLVGRTLNENDPAYEAIVPAVVSGQSVTVYASLQSQVVTIDDIELDLKNTIGCSCTTSTCWAVVNSAGLVKVSGRERTLYPEYYRPTIQGTISNLALDKWIVNGTVMLDGFLLRELDFEKAEQYRNGEIAVRKQRKYIRFVPANNQFVDVTDYVDVKLAEYSPLCEMALCDRPPIFTKLPEELLPTGVTYTPAEGEKYGCKDAYEFVLGPGVTNSPYNFVGYGASGCSYSHTTNECNGVVSKSITLLEFWKQYSLDAVVNGRSASGGWAYYCVPDILTWLEYTPPPLVKGGGTYTVGGTYDPTKGRYGKCLSGGVAYLPDIDGTCHPAEINIDIGSFSDPSFFRGGIAQENSGASVYIKNRLSAFSGTHVLAPSSQNGCTGMYYFFGALGTEVVDVDSFGRTRTRRDYLSLGLNYHTGYTAGPNLSGGPAPFGCNRSSSFDYLRIEGGIFIAKQESGFPLSVYGDALYVFSCWLGGNPPSDLATSFYTTFFGALTGCATLGQNGPLVVSGRDAGSIVDGASTYGFLASPTISKSDGSPMPSCNGVSYTPTDFTIDNTATADRRLVGSPWIWGNTPGTTLTVTTEPTGNYQLCGGAKTTFGSFYNDRSQDRVYTRYVYSDGSDPTQITVTVKGTCIAYPHGLFEGRTYFSYDRGLITSYSVPYYGLYFGYPEAEFGGCVMLPIKTNGTECEWEVTSNDEWLTLAKDTEKGTGDGRVDVLFEPLQPSEGVYDREGTLTLSCNGRTTTIKVRQGGYRWS
jgi:hypothetical protein